MAKYHIGKRGLPVICTAKEGNCPLNKGNNNVPHFSSKENAIAYLDYSNSLIYDNSVANKIETNNLSSSEIKGYIDLNNNQIELLEKENKDIRGIVNTVADNSIKNERNNRTEEEKEIISETSEMFKKGYIKRKEHQTINDHSENFVIDKTNIVPTAYFDGVQGPVKLLSEHSLIYKFGPNKGKAILDPSKITEKNLNWINQYKDNPELLKSDLEKIQSNMKKFNKLFYLNQNNQMSLKSDYIINKELIKGMEKVKTPITSSDQEKENDSNIRQLYKLQEQLKEDYDIHKKIESYQKESNIVTSFNSKSVPVDNDGTKQFKITENLTVDKNGNINNLYIYDRDKVGNPLIRVTSLNDNTSNNIITEQGTFNIITHYARRKLGRMAMAHDGTNNFDFIVTSPPKNSSDYNGTKIIHHSYFDTTE